MCFKKTKIHCLCYGFRLIKPEKTSVWNLYMYMYICLCIYMNKPDYISMFLLEWNNLNENMNVF